MLLNSLLVGGYLGPYRSIGCIFVASKLPKAVHFSPDLRCKLADRTSGWIWVDLESEAKATKTLVLQTSGDSSFFFPGFFMGFLGFLWFFLLVGFSGVWFCELLVIFGNFGPYCLVPFGDFI